MEKYDLLPSDENLKKTLEDDSTGRNKYIYSFLKLITSQQGSWSMALNGAWGTGKTFFIKQTQYILDSLNLENGTNKEKILSILDCSEEDIKDILQKNFRTVYYDAWVHDDEEDPIKSLLSCIPRTKWSKKVIPAVITTLDVGADLLNAIGPVNLKSLTSKLKDNYDEYSQSLEVLKQEFNKALEKLVPSNGQLIIFIDELDRCRPTYAIKLLERIKHYFNNPNITFIFSVDLQNLQNTVKHYYGSEFNGYHYLDRFFDLVINLPEPNLEKYLDNTKNILDIDGLFDKRKDSYYHLFCIELIKHYSFSLRQVTHFYLKLNSAAYNLISHSLNGTFSTISNGSFILYAFFLPYMCALEQDNVSQYNKFIQGRATDEDLNFLAQSPTLTQYLKGLFSNDSTRNLNTLIEVKKIYNAIFGDSDDYELIICNQAKIESLDYYRNQLIKACTLLGEQTKL